MKYHLITIAGILACPFVMLLTIRLFLWAAGHGGAISTEWVVLIFYLSIAPAMIWFTIRIEDAP
ncbi:MAG: hypothetical protein QM523_01130 [Candidatus Pacebacteria bacterium]|nr:hypothetical protein [Candidatus Paceibacterota bacterium]